MNPEARKPGGTRNAGPKTGVMDKQTCKRCFHQEEIATHQFVKFDDRVQYLCRQCWEGFRRWFHWGQNDPRERQLELF